MYCFLIYRKHNGNETNFASSHFQKALAEAGADLRRVHAELEKERAENEKEMIEERERKEDWKRKAIRLEKELKEERYKNNSSCQSIPIREIGHIPWGLHSDSNSPRAENVNPEPLGSPLSSPEPSPTEELEDEDQAHTSTLTECSAFATPEESKDSS